MHCLRPPTPIRYVVIPTDPANATQITHTSTLLQNLDTTAHLIPKRTPEGTVVWLLKSHNPDLEPLLSALDGVDVAERDLMHTGVRKYVVPAAELYDAEKTERFLMTKMQESTQFRRALDDDGVTILGWYGVVLSGEAAREVEEHEGVEWPLGLDEVKHC